jgi:hypothetical protein
VFIETRITLNVVEEVEDGVTNNLTLFPEISLLKDAKESPVLIIPYSVL